MLNRFLLKWSAIPFLWEIWPVVLLSRRHCSVRHRRKQKSDVQFGPNHNICTSLLFTFSLSGRSRNVNFRWVFLWVVITVIKNARETPGEPALRCSLTCCIINTELMSYFMRWGRKTPNSFEKVACAFCSRSILLRDRANTRVDKRTHIPTGLLRWCFFGFWWVCQDETPPAAIVLCCSTATVCRAAVWHLHIQKVLWILFFACTYKI